MCRIGLLSEMREKKFYHSWIAAITLIELILQLAAATQNSPEWMRMEITEIKYTFTHIANSLNYKYYGSLSSSLRTPQAYLSLFGIYQEYDSF